MLQRAARAAAELTVLDYHQVKDHGQRLLDGQHRKPSAQQMEFLQQHHRVVSLSEGVRAVASGAIAERLVAITFDDGYQDNATIAAPILRELGIAGAASSSRPT